MIKKIVLNLKLFFIPCEENNYRPEFLGSRFLAVCIIVLVVAKLIAIVFFVNLPKTVFFADLTKTALVNLTNQERKTAGLQPLKSNERLEIAAYLKAQDMVEKDYFAHQSPSGKTPWAWLKEANYSYKYAGENLAVGFLDSGEVIQAWQESPAHRKNLLNPNYQEIGIAVVKGDFQGSETTIVVQFLGTPAKVKTISPKLTQETKPKEIEEPSEQKPQQPAAEGEPRPGREEKEVIPSESEETLSETVKEESVGGEEAGEEKIRVAAYQIENKETIPDFSLFRFMTEYYPDILQKIIFYFLFLITIALILNIFIRIDIQDKGLILKAIIFIILLTLLIVSDKELITQLIPHNLII